MPQRLWSEDRRLAMPVEGIREGANGQFVVRFARKREHHPRFDPAEDAAIEHIQHAFIAWLEFDDGHAVQVVRLSPARGALLADEGRWAVDYAPVATVNSEQ